MNKVNWSFECSFSTPSSFPFVFCHQIACTVPMIHCSPLWCVQMDLTGILPILFFCDISENNTEIDRHLTDLEINVKRYICPGSRNACKHYPSQLCKTLVLSGSGKVNRERIPCLLWALNFIKNFFISYNLNDPHQRYPLYQKDQKMAFSEILWFLKWAPQLNLSSVLCL